MNAYTGSLPYAISGESKTPEEMKIWWKERKMLEELAETIHKARWPADRQMDITPFADEDRNGREYCFRIAKVVLASGYAKCALYREALDKALDVAHEKMNKMDNLPGEAWDAFNLACEAAQSALTSTDGLPHLNRNE